MTERSMEIVNDNDNNKKKEGDDQEEKEEEEEEEEIVLPGFRFHPTDEELVGFYLRRKVDKKPLRIELIKQIDLYKYDPWDLPKEASSGSVGEKEKEWYFFCKRGRKYRNSIRPNRVTGSGFWKATGIDKAIHSVKKEGNNNNYDDDEESIIGLKKSLVYYRGTAGKGTKTDWMMHEFRLPPASNANRDANPNHLQEAEVWTLCRIFKRIPSYKKYTPSLKDTATAAAAATTKPNNYQTISSNSKTCSLESDNKNSTPYLTSSFRTSDSSSPIIFHNHQQQQQNINVERKPPVDERSHLFLQGHLPHYHHHHLQPPSSMVANYYNPSLLMNHHQSVEDVFANGNWDELTSVVQFAVDHPSTIYDCTLNRQIDR